MNLPYRYLGIFCLVAFLAAGAWWVWQTIDLHFFKAKPSEARQTPNPKEYELLLADLQRWQKELSSAYQKASSSEEKERIEHDAEQILHHILPSMMDCWLGTEYDFNGTAEKPGSGKLACGYFVSTILQDAAFRVNRFTLAQQASENILRSMISSNYCELSIGQSYPSFLEMMAEKKPGIYLIGLDSHVGFLVKNQQEFYFYHSSKWKDRGVVKENGREAFGLKQSNWRMLGSLTEDPKLIQTWLKNQVVKVRTS